MGAANIGNDNPMICYTIVPHHESLNYANRWASSACPCRVSALHSARLVLIGGLQSSLIHTRVMNGRICWRYKTRRIQKIFWFALELAEVQDSCKEYLFTNVHLADVTDQASWSQSRVSNCKNSIRSGH